MKTSSPTSPKTPEPKSILLIGAPGTRKTTLALRFPKPYILNCDQNLDGPETYLRSAEKAPLDYAYDDVQLLDNGQQCPPEVCCDRLISLLDKARTEPAIKTIVVDSLTWVNEFVVQKILKQQSRQQMQIPDWGTFRSVFGGILFTKLRTSGKTSICIVHEKPVYTPNPKNPMLQDVLKYDNTVQGQVGDALGAFFTDVWRCEARVAAFGKNESWIVVDKTEKSPDLKNSFGLPNKEIKVNDNNDWNNLWKHLEGKV